MTPLKDVRTSLSRAEYDLDQLQALLDERDKLVNVLHLDPSSEDNQEVTTRIQKLFELINSCRMDSPDNATLNQLIETYNSLVQQAADDENLSIDQQLLIAPKTTTKSVRFKDESDDNLDTELMGTRSFKPYRDDESTDESFDHTTNQQLFAQHQQQILEQDHDLEALHQSIYRQNQMGRSISTELDEHLIVLDDLERGVDDAQIRLNRAVNRLGTFTRRVRENGSLVTIIVLTVILILLLVVLN